MRIECSNFCIFFVCLCVFLFVFFLFLSPFAIRSMLLCVCLCVCVCFGKPLCFLFFIVFLKKTHGYKYTFLFPCSFFCWQSLSLARVLSFKICIFFEKFILSFLVLRNLNIYIQFFFFWKTKNCFFLFYFVVFAKQ